MATINFRVRGMHCSGCEATIEHALSPLPGVLRVKASYVDATVEIDVDDGAALEGRVRRAIEDCGYQLEEPSRQSQVSRAVNGLLVVVLLLIVGGVAFWGRSLMPSLIRQMTGQVAYPMLFSIGFLTGFHCIGMCGGFVVSYVTALSPRTPARVAVAHLQYALGKTTSYVLMGAAFGLLGSLVTITQGMRGVAALVAGVFVVLFGLRMLGVFSFARRVTLPLPPFLARRVATEVGRHRHPLVIGLLTGLLLGCGPLQAMYVMSAGTGSPKEGAAILLFFGLGTLAPLLSFGLLASLLSRNVRGQLVRASGILMIVMGVLMVDRGVRLTRSAQRVGSAPAPQTQLGSAILRHPSVSSGVATQ